MGRELDFIAFNCNSNVLSNKEVRQAISYAIDKQNIVSAIYSGKYYTCNFPFEYGNYLYGDNKVSYEYNIENARKILQDNGWTYNKKTWQKTKDYKTIRLRLNLVVNSSNEKRVQVAENIKASLENLGITINIIKDPINSDIDKSNRIDIKESIFLGLAMSIDSISIGFGASAIGINNVIFPLLISIFQIIFLSIGRIIGNNINDVSKLPKNIWSIVSGILLICIGISKLI